MNALIETIVKEVVCVLNNEIFVEVEASGRHVHLSREDIDTLFGKGYELTKAKDLSQPGQFACKERVTIVGPKNSLKNVAILGPARKESQVEISLTDATVLGLHPKIKESGHLEETTEVTIKNNESSVNLNRGLIVAKRHIHMTPDDAKRLNVKDKQNVKVKVFGERPLIFDDVVIRVREDFMTYMHIDYDEANACGFRKGTKAMILNNL